MKLRSILTMFVFAGLVSVGLSADAFAHEKFENLKVLKDNGKTLEKGMKGLSKGLGVKCTACHVKGDFDSDKVETKGVAREFFKKVVGTKDGREEALKPLLKALKLDKVKKADKLWAGVDMLQKK